MNKKILFTLSLLSIVVFLSSCGGGGGGGLSTPPGTNTGVPSVVKLLDVQNIAQTNSTVYMKAKVLDGNGNPVQNVPVTFTNLSAPFAQLGATVVNTDATGVATVTLQSSLPGFSTVLAEINTGAGQVRDRNTVFFTNLIFEYPDPPSPPPPSMSLDVDSVPGNNIFNQPSDFILFENTSDDSVEIIATVFNGDGSRVGPGKSVTWEADHTEVEFVRKDIITDGNGQAQAIIKVKPDTLRDTETHVNIGVSADNGAVSMVTLFLKSVTVNSVALVANPATVASGGSSEITAYVTTTAGTPVPDGTIVTFNTSGGSISTLFDTTTDGIANVTLTAPAVTANTNITITASVGGKSGSARVSVEAGEPDALMVIPGAITIVRDAAVAKTATFTISGGTTPYITTSNNPLLGYNGTLGNGVWGPSSSSALTVTIPAGDTAGAVTLTVTDAKGQTKTAMITVTTPAGGGGGGGGTTGQPLGISPTSATVTGINNTSPGGDGNPVDDLTFVISNVDGIVNCNSSHTSVINSPGTVFFSTSTFEIDPDEVAATTVVTITCTDSNTGFVAATVVTVNPPGLTIRANPIQVIGRANPDANTTDDVTIEVIGGTGPYIVTASQPSIVAGGPWASNTLPWSFTVDPTNVPANTTVTFTVTDGAGSTATTTLVVYTEDTPLVTSTSKENVIGLANPDSDTADDVSITVSGANSPFIVSWVANQGGDCAISATPAGPYVVNAASGTVTFDPGANTTSVAKACTVNVTDKFGAVNTLTINVFP